MRFGLLLLLVLWRSFDNCIIKDNCGFIDEFFFEDNFELLKRPCIVVDWKIYKNAAIVTCLSILLGLKRDKKPQKISTWVLTKTKQRQALEEWTRLMISHQQQKALIIIKMSFLGWKVSIKSKRLVPIHQVIGPTDQMDWWSMWRA